MTEENVKSEEITNKLKDRIKSIDIVRGICIAIMFLVDNRGSWQRAYPILTHSEWNGITIADIGFPIFILSLGASIPISIDSKIKKNIRTSKIITSIIRRSILLFIFGLFFNYLKNNDLNTIRILGVLQRMAIVYFLTSILYFSIKKLHISDIKISAGFVI
ncbi:MAG: DUF5009 domain-containing protein, partial [Clostridioides sp.]|nr:DUF5009 domain-containing protein [Clostridioides sp.]